MRLSGWNKCIYCGKFISVRDFESGKAKSEFAYTSPSDFEPNDKVESYHVSCKEVAE